MTMMSQFVDMISSSNVYAIRKIWIFENNWKKFLNNKKRSNFKKTKKEVIFKLRLYVKGRQPVERKIQSCCCEKKEPSRINTFITPENLVPSKLCIFAWMSNGPLVWKRIESKAKEKGPNISSSIEYFPIYFK